MFESAVKTKASVTDCLVVCQADFESAGTANGSVFFTVGGVAASYCSPSNCVIICAGNYQGRSADHCAFLCGKKLEFKGDLVGCSVVCFGNAEIKGLVHNSSLYCFGNAALQNVSGSNIYCNGDVKIGGSLDKTQITAKGMVTLSPLAEQSQKAGVSRFSVAKLQRKLDFSIRFFSAELLGVRLADGRKDLGRVTAVVPESVLGNAGITAEDTITSVNGTNFKEMDAIISLLRRGTARGLSSFAIRRGDKEINLKVVPR